MRSEKNLEEVGVTSWIARPDLNGLLNQLNRAFEIPALEREYA